jgi:hypothetical protein
LLAPQRALAEWISHPGNRRWRPPESAHDIVRTTSIGGPRRRSEHGNRSEGADLPRGQVIVRGVALFDVNFDPLKPLTFAIVGGTGAYEGASGQVIQSGPDCSIRTLKIVL